MTTAINLFTQAWKQAINESLIIQTIPQPNQTTKPQTKVSTNTHPYHTHTLTFTHDHENQPICTYESIDKQPYVINLLAIDYHHHYNNKHMGMHRLHETTHTNLRNVIQDILGHRIHSATIYGRNQKDPTTQWIPLWRLSYEPHQLRIAQPYPKENYNNERTWYTHHIITKTELIEKKESEQFPYDWFTHHLLGISKTNYMAWIQDALEKTTPFSVIQPVIKQLTKLRIPELDDKRIHLEHIHDWLTNQRIRLHIQKQTKMQYEDLYETLTRTITALQTIQKQIPTAQQQLVTKLHIHHSTHRFGYYYEHTNQLGIALYPNIHHAHTTYVTYHEYGHAIEVYLLNNANKHTQDADVRLREWLDYANALRTDYIENKQPYYQQTYPMTPSELFADLFAEYMYHQCHAPNDIHELHDYKKRFTIDQVREFIQFINRHMPEPFAWHEPTP